MRTIQASEAKTHFLRVLDQVERGESVIVTRHGKPVARISPENILDRERTRKAFARIRTLRSQNGRMSVDELLSARDEGRR